MEQISVIGIDLAKRVFQLCALDGAGEVVWTKRLKRAAFARFLEDEAPRSLVGLEACGGAHHWGRWLEARGFTVKLMAPQAVKAYRRGPNKNDLRDARAIAEAASRAHVSVVRLKGAPAQAVQALARVRERRVRQMVQTANQLRGILNEFGMALPKGSMRMCAEVRKRLAGEADGLPASVKELAEALIGEIAEQSRQVEAATLTLMRSVKNDDSCVRLMTIPNIGTINAAALAVALEVPSAFRNGRSFVAHLGLSPRQHASAEKSRQLGIGRQRANETRRYLVLAAQGLLTRVARMKEPPADHFLLWARALLVRKNRNVAAVAVAAKLARIAWAVTARNAPYNPRLAQEFEHRAA